MAACLAAGADAVRVGTRFLAATETDVHPEYVAALLKAGGGDTEYGETFSAGSPHRTLRAAAEAARAFEGEVVGEQWRDGTWQPWLRFRGGGIDKHTRGKIAAMPQWAGQGVGLVRRVQPAAAIVAEMAEEAEALLRRW
jgi:nitronate monooxygenase